MSVPLSQHGPRGEPRPGVGTGESGFDKSGILKEYAARFHVKTLVETGLYYGCGSGMDVDVEQYVAIDYQDENIALAKEARPDGLYLKGDSGVELAKMLGRFGLSWSRPLLPRPMLFWLDAHALSEDEASPTVCPVLYELEVIGEWAHASESVVLVDDLWGMGTIRGWPTLDELREAADRPGVWHRVEQDGIMRLTPSAVPGSSSPGAATS